MNQFKNCLQMCLLYTCLPVLVVEETVLFRLALDKSGKCNCLLEKAASKLVLYAIIDKILKIL